ncbi:hypothetical protein FPV67DRAFT_1668701 [Lyophyllum atratum]|nr:hypothetical protein FPV67DRAFT_1668701 [Lyophyllum atratum]
MNVSDNVDHMKTVSPTRKARKRVRVEVDENDPRRFLSLEAADVFSDDDDDDEQEGMDDFLHGDELVPGDREGSHHRLFQEHTRAAGDHQWEALLARARERGRPSDSLDADDVYGNMAMTEHPTLWRVPVKLGCEESVTFILMEKVIRAGRWNIKSIIGRVSRPGCVVIEAAAASDVADLCQAVSNVFSSEIHVVPSDHVRACLKEPPLFIPRPASWVRLSKPPYEGDLAYVKALDFDSAPQLLVVPRIDFQRGKRRRGGRIEQALFDENRVRDVWGQQAVSRRNQVLVFKGAVYDHGFLWLTTYDCYPEEAVPTSEELALFLKSPSIPPAVFQRTVEIMGARRLQVGDSVKVVAGQAKGALGVVEDILNENVVVALGTISQTLPILALRKFIRIGDEVQVTVGPHAGFEGWVVALIEDSVLIYDHKTSKEVVVRSDCVHFWESPFITVDNRFRVGSEVVVTHGEHAGAQGPVISCTSNHVLLHDLKGQKARSVPLDCVQSPAVALSPSKTQFGKDPHYHLIGKHVRVIKKNIFKDYEAIIKSTEEHNFVWIEVQATMRRERIHLSNLCFLNDPQMQPLNLSLRSPAVPAPAAAIPSTRPYIPVSSLPLIASTPLPPSTSVTFSPAWDPSSRTPDSALAFRTRRHFFGGKLSLIATSM